MEADVENHSRRRRRHKSHAPSVGLWIAGILLLAMLSGGMSWYLSNASPSRVGVIQTPKTGIPDQVLFSKFKVTRPGSKEAASSNPGAGRP